MVKMLEWLGDMGSFSTEIYTSYCGVRIGPENILQKQSSLQVGMC